MGVCRPSLLICIMKKLDDSNFMLYTAANYDNLQCYDVEEFEEDLNRIKYIKRLFFRYKESGELKERLILNHLIVIYNVFPAAAATRILFFKLTGYESYLKTFLVFLGYMPDIIMCVGEQGNNIRSSDIPINLGITEILRTI